MESDYLRASAPMSVAEALEEFESELRRVGSAAVERRRPGLTRSRIDSVTEPLGIRVPDELVAWFEWQDGVDLQGSPYLTDATVGRFQLTALSDLVKHCEMCREVLADAMEEDNIWRPDFLPIALTDTGDDLVCDCSVQDRAELRMIDPESLETPSASLEQVLRWWSDAIKSGVWTYDQETGFWAYDADKLQERHPFWEERSFL